MIKEYLKERKAIVENEIVGIEEKAEMSEISIKQLDAQIKNVSSEIDESAEMLSVSVRNKMAAKEDELSNMERHKEKYGEEISKFQKEIDEKKKELNVIDRCLKEVGDTNVSRETFREETRDKQDCRTKPKTNNLKDALEFCKKICEVDAKRAKIELEKIIKEM